MSHTSEKDTPIVQMTSGRRFNATLAFHANNVACRVAGSRFALVEHNYRDESFGITTSIRIRIIAVVSLMPDEDRENGKGVL